MKKISVIVPGFRVEAFLHRCINSILTQSFSEFELFVIDDGSPDNSGSMCDEDAIADDRTIVIHQMNGGLSAARNSGIDLAFVNAESRWITFIDSDDWIHPMYLETLYTGTKKYSVDISVCGYESTPGYNPAVDSNKLFPLKVNSEDFYITKTINAMVAWGKLYKKELFRDIRYPVGKLHEDEFTTYKLLFQQKWIAWIDQPLYAYFQNNTGIMQSRWNPKRLDGLEGQQEQLQFYEANGLLRIKEYAVQRYLSEICSHYYLSMRDYPNVSKKLQKRLRKELHKYKDIAGLSIQDNFRICYAAYPFETKVVSYINAIKRRIR